MTAAPDPRLVEASARLRDGQAAAAATLCRAVLAATPADVRAWELLGVAASSAGDRATAQEAFHRVVEIEPDRVSGLLNLGAILGASGNAARAVDLFRKAQRIEPDNETAALFLARAMGQLADLDAAIGETRTALAAQPRNAPLWFELAKLLLRAGDRDGAIEAFERQLAIDPDNAGALLALGRVRHATGRIADALALAEKALATGDLAAAAHSLAAELLLARGDVEAATAHAQDAMRLDDGAADGYRAMALVHLRNGDTAAAATAFEAAIARAPKRADLLVALGDARSQARDRDGAMEAYRRAIAIAPDLAEARTRLFVELRDICRWAEADALRPAIDRATDDAIARGQRVPETPFVDVMVNEDPARNLAVARSWAREVERHVAGLARPVFRTPGAGPLRIGYLTDEMRDHAIGHHVAGLFERHDRDRVSVHVYSHGNDDGSEWARRARDGADSFVDIAPMDDAAAAQRIADDGIEILVDLKGYTRGARLEILALRPAPVQLAWLGFPGSYGASFIDYVLTDRIVTPPSFQRWFDEALCCLPNCYQVNDDRFVADAPATTRAAEGLPETGFVFCCFNKCFKVPAGLFDLWLAILDAVPGACLWLWGRDPRAIDAMRVRTRARGLDPLRLVFAKRVTLATHLRRLALADLALDTLPYNGHATTSNALWAGVPLLTVLGRHFAGRVSASLLSAAGLPQAVMPDLDAYRRRAIDLARDPAALAALRAELAAARKTAPFFDTGRFVRNLENAYAAIGDRHRRGERAATLLIEEDA